MLAILWIAGKHAGPGRINPGLLSGKFDPAAKFAVFNNRRLSLPGFLAEENKEAPRVLGQTSAPKRIEVDLTHQRLYAFEGRRLVYNFLVSTGKWHYTPHRQFPDLGKTALLSNEGRCENFAYLLLLAQRSLCNVSLQSGSSQVGGLRNSRHLLASQFWPSDVPRLHQHENGGGGPSLSMGPAGSAGEVERSRWR